MTLTPQESSLARERGDLGSGTTEDILTILVRVCPGFDVEAFLLIAGGRQWYVPTAHSYRRTRRYVAIIQDRRTDAHALARDHHVSVCTIYRAWRSGAA